MTNDTDLANAALGLLGEMPISSITDATSKPARVCNAFAAAARIEVLRAMHLTEATAISAMDASAKAAVACRLAAMIAVPLLGSQEVQGKMEQLYAIRLQDAKVRVLHSSALNGKILAMIGNDLAKVDLSPAMLTEFSTTFQADATKEVLRLTHAVSEATAYGSITDPLVLEAIDARHAAKIAGALTLPSAQVLEQQFTLRIQEARVRDLNSSAINGQILAMLGADLAKFDLSPAMMTLYGVTYQAEATKEVLRLTHAASEATLYASVTDPLMLETIDLRHALKIATALTLPSAQVLEQQFAVRLQENKVRLLHTSALNGKILAMIGNDLSKIDISPTMLTEFGLYQAEATKEVLRLTHGVETTLYAAVTDPLIIEAIDLRQALKIATALTLPSAAALEQQFALRLQETKVRLLHTSALNGKILAMLGNDLSKIDISPTMLTEFGLYQAEATKEVLRLTHAASEATLYASVTDPLIIEAIDLRQALKIATALTLPSAAALEQQFALRLQETKVRLLHSSGLNGQILAMIGNDLAKVDLSPTMLTLFVTTYAADALKEVLRMGRWGCAIKRATLVASTAPTVGEFLYKYTLPATCLRVLEVNGEAVNAASEYFEIEGAFVLTNATPTWIRYVDAITLAACDPLLAHAINARHVAKIAAALTLPSTPALEGLFQKRLAEARQHDAMENGGAEKPSWARVFGRSRLLQARGYGRNPLRMENF